MHPGVEVDVHRSVVVALSVALTLALVLARGRVAIVVVITMIAIILHCGLSCLVTIGNDQDHDCSVFAVCVQVFRREHP